MNLTSHLYAIFQAPEHLWQWLTEQLLEQEWSVRETEAAVQVCLTIDIPEPLQAWMWEITQILTPSPTVQKWQVECP